jgi:hypothetical protein
MKIAQNPGYRILLILLLFLVGCAAPSEPRPLTETFEKAIIIDNRVTLHIPTGLTMQQSALLISASAFQLKEFETDWSEPTRPVHVWFSRGNGANIPCGDLVGDFWGCHYGPNGPIHIFLDEHYIAISLYHELVHHNVGNQDHDHDDPRWESEWEPKQQALRATLYNRHKKILN